MQRDETVINNNHFLQGLSEIVQPFCEPKKKKDSKNGSPRQRTSLETKEPEQLKLEATRPGTYNGKLYATTIAANFAYLELGFPCRR